MTRDEAVVYWLRAVVIAMWIALIVALGFWFVAQREQNRADACYQQSMQYKQALVAETQSIQDFFNDPLVAPDLSDTTFHVKIAQSLECKK